METQLEKQLKKMQELLAEASADRIYMITDFRLKECQKTLADVRYDAILAFNIKDCFNNYGEPPAYICTPEFKLFEFIAKVYANLVSLKSTGNINSSQKIAEDLTGKLEKFLLRCEFLLASGREVKINSSEEHAGYFINDLNNYLAEHNFFVENQKNDDRSQDSVVTALSGAGFSIIGKF